MITVELFFVFCVSVLGLYGRNANAQSNSNMIVEKSSWCTDVPEQKIKFYVNLKDFNPGLQLVDINATLLIPIGNEIMINAVLDFNANSNSNDNLWIHLITIDGEMCKTLGRYVGEFWEEALTALGIMRRSCPLPRGTYHAFNHRLDFNKLKIQTFPVGKTRVTIKLRKQSETLLCVIYIVSVHST